ncbi:hypothetical protein MWN33_02035 [Starkeya koreensis]|uniref:Uncharacterized protein n=1 Tax=Ancylobacter koreensis TaxID=266121 RepID=A0ABT0DHP6_9HYPH|nr:hypothetical protein [Ancylobacter koreensis]MCK0206805.1 hypothetical protein [Ancylobacter koreensis]
MRRLLPVAFAALSLSLMPLPAAAQAVFPGQGTIGLVPPPGMEEIPGVPGFQDRSTRASILVREMPKPAYQEIVSTYAPEELQSQGVTVEERRDIDLADGVKAIVLKGYQTVGAAALKKWILIAGGKEQTGMVTVQFPEAASSRYPDATVEAALRSVVFRAPPTTQELLARLPFQLEELEGYRVLKVLGASAVLLTRSDSGKPELGDDPFFIVAAAQGEIREDDRESIAKRAIASVPGIKELRVDRGGPLRIGGQPGFELVGSAVDARSDKPVKVVQWLRFGRTGYLRMVGVAPADSFEAEFGPMRGLRDGIELR